MPLLARTVVTPIVIEVRRGAVGALAPLLADGRISSGGKVAIALGSGQGASVQEQLSGAIPAASTFDVRGSTLDSAQALIAELRSDYYDAVVGIGGGGTLDVAKYAASMTGLPFVSVATTLTHDGIASPVATLATMGRKASFGVNAPIAVFVDMEFVEQAPERHLRSGLGDVLSNLSAIADWYLASEVRGETVDGLAVTFARSAAEAVLHTESDLRDESFLITLAESLVLSGIAMAVSGTSRPCSGACHEISHALDASHGSPGLHGEQVALGALFATWLRGDHGLAAQLDAAFRRFDLPRTPKDLDIEVGAFVEAVLEAPRTRPGRFTILEHLDLDERGVQESVDGFTAAFSG